ncbi:uncharacterized protein BO72DRAFT_458638 [Aspergillus fijiensis CBS 313.89]|uniref:Uncharacterized protein n=1 Tax=Aspergillus fijiensis CBS 313.89 TaxID=1448319 RepID=A0A8G1RV79_9EURO|nr:uncharacterized protein BO72DRAFT_458638 [Aspergillus fijiensis CBS 313.89]RAK77376.1 hypothetical protein BO72DRAFT_458638 [Aspergillus fijiensis CBS 313.89]
MSQSQSQSKAQAQAESQVPNQPRPFLPRVTDIGSLPYGGLPGRCVYGPDDPPAHFDARLTNHFVRPHPEASLSWDGHHLLQLLEQKDVETMRVMDGYRPLVLEPEQYLARFWCHTDDAYYYFVCTKMQGLEYCSRFVRWVNVKSTLHPAVEATTGPGLQQRNQALDDRIIGVRDQLRRKDQYAELVVLEQQHGERASQQMQEELDQQPQRQQVQQQQPQEKQPKKQLSQKQQQQQMQGFHRFRLVRQEQPQQQQPQPQPQPQQMQQGQLMQESFQFALAQQEQQWDQQQWEQALERSSQQQQQQKEEQGER